VQVGARCVPYTRTVAPTIPIFFAQTTTHTLRRGPSYNAETWGEGIYGPGTASQSGAIPSCANKGILNDLARDKWGFNGYITSDCGAVGNVQNQHQYTDTPDKTVTAVLSAGMDTVGVFEHARITPLFTATDTSAA
jgi:hypothetical protein